MDRKYLIKAIKIALKEADRKPLNEAAEIIADNIILVEEILNDVPMPVQVSPMPTTSPAGAETDCLPVSMHVGAEALPPPASAPTKVLEPDRIYHTAKELMESVDKGMPPSLQVGTAGKSAILAIRSVTALQEQEGCGFGVKVGYSMQGYSSNVNASFWVTQEDFHFSEAVESIQDQLERIYSFVPKAAINRTPPPKPGQMKGDSV